MIGNSQTLSIGSLSLSLGEDDFAAEFAGGLGYRRSLLQAHQVQVNQSFFGASIVDGPSFPAKYEFEWQLWLRQGDALLLEAIAQTQQTLAKTQQPCAVRLRDQRLAKLEPTPRTRAKVGTTGITAPTGYTVIWPQFDILLTLPSDFSEWYFWDTSDLYQIKITATELDLVGVGADV